MTWSPRSPGSTCVPPCPPRRCCPPGPRRRHSSGCTATASPPSHGSSGTSQVSPALTWAGSLPLTWARSPYLGQVTSAGPGHLPSPGLGHLTWTVLPPLPHLGQVTPTPSPGPGELAQTPVFITQSSVSPGPTFLSSPGTGNPRGADFGGKQRENGNFGKRR